MRRFKLLITTVALCSLITSYGFCKKAKIAVFDFKETGCKVKDVGKYASNKINDLVVGLGTVDVIDRVNLAQILEEQKLGLSGIIDTSSAVEMGKVLGVNYIIFGEVSQANVIKKDAIRTKSVKTASGKYEKKRWKVWEYKGSASLQIRVVNIENGKIIYSGSKSVTKKEDAPYVKTKQETVVELVKAMRGTKTEEKVEDPNEIYSHLVTKAIDSCVKKGFNLDIYNLFRLSGYVIKINRSSREVVIDIGTEDGIKKGEKYWLIEMGEPIIHPVTKEEIPGEEIVINDFKIKKVGKNTSKGKVSKKTLARIKVGTIIKAREKKGGLLRY